MVQSQRFEKSVFWMYIFSYAAAPLGYFIRILYSKELTLEEFGLLYAIIGFVAFISVFNDLGFSETLNYYGTRFFEKKEYAKLKASIHYAALMQGVTSVIIMLGIFFTRDFWIQTYFSSEMARNGLLLFGIYFLAYNLINALNSSFNVLQKTYISAFMNFAKMLLTFLLSLIILFVPNKLYVVCMVWALVAVCMFVLVLFLYLKEFHFLRSVEASYSQQLFKRVFSYAKYVFVGSGLAVILSSMDIQIITIMVDLESVALYSNAFAVASIILIAMSPMLSVLFPFVAKFAANKKIKELSTYYNLLLRIYVYIFTPAVIVFIAFPAEILSFLFGGSYVEGVQILQLLSVAIFFSAIAQLNLVVLSGLGEVKLKNTVSIYAGVINLTVSVLLAYFFGLFGVVIGTVSSFFVLMIFSFFYVAKKVLIEIKWSYIFKVLCLNILLYGLLFFLKSSITYHIVIEFCLIGMIAFPLYILFGYVFRCYDKSTIHFFTKELQQYTKRKRK